MMTFLDQDHIIRVVSIGILQQNGNSELVHNETLSYKNILGLIPLQPNINPIQHQQWILLQYFHFLNLKYKIQHVINKTKTVESIIILIVTSIKINCQTIVLAIIFRETIVLKFLLQIYMKLILKQKAEYNLISISLFM